MKKNNIIILTLVFGVSFGLQNIFSLKKYDHYIIDFANCKPSIKTISFAMGSMTFHIMGKSNGECILRYGGEIENPHWDGYLDTLCAVSQKLGKATFKFNHMGFTMRKIKKYCVILSKQ